MAKHGMKEETNTRPNVEVVRQVYDAFKRREIAEVLSLFAPDIVITQSTEIPWGGKFQGRDAARECFIRLTQAINSTLTIERFVDAGDCVVAIGRTQGTVNSSGNRYDVPIAHVWEIQEGLVVSAQFYIDNPTMLAVL